MKLHTFPEDFRELITVVADEKHISESAVERDYYIVMMLKALADSPYAEQCVFKGGTSLSKCYPGSIERFSEDIDLTFLGMELSDKICDRSIKKIETVMSAGAQTEKIPQERSDRSKSMYVWFGDPKDRVKLEIGSTVRPDPYCKRVVKTYIQEFLESRGFEDEIARFDLTPVEINTLNIERTFIDKIMSVKRHAICGTLNRKVRHVYDVTRLYQMPEIQAFLAEKDELKRLLRLTKETDSFYIGRRNISIDYDPTGPYDFPAWRHFLDASVSSIYETLHQTLLYSDEKQNFEKAVWTFESINDRLKEIGE
ncbi:MAG: nucleotidyl transferase AbiEii/AbiGii toxin family protein [Faecousia sp.]